MIRSRFFNFYIASLLFGVLVGISSACQLQDDVTFFVSEVSEDFEKGGLLPDCLPIIKGPYETVHIIQDYGNNPEDNSAWEYTSAVMNPTSDCIEFYLLKELSTYRKEKWEPSLESEFTIVCSGEYITFTYLLLIKDENLYLPKFDSEIYNGLLTYDKLNGFQLHFNTTKDEVERVTNSGIGIRITDFDFNPQNADVTLSCLGSCCPYFIFELTDGTFVQGYNYGVDIQLNLAIFKDNVRDDDYLSMELVANDSLKASTAEVRIYIEIEDQVTPNGSPFPMKPVAIAGGLALVVFVGCSATLAYFIVRTRQSKDIVRKLTEAEIREFLNGTANLNVDAGKRSVDVNTPIMALPYNQKFEIPREKLRIDETTILGTGAFGVVWRGSVVFSNGDGITVAVKSIKKNVGVLYFKALLSELKIMAYLGKHPNIVSLVGACTHNIRKSKQWLGDDEVTIVLNI